MSIGHCNYGKLVTTFKTFEDLVLFATTNFWVWCLSANVDESAVLRSRRGNKLREIPVASHVLLSVRDRYSRHLLWGKSYCVATGRAYIWCIKPNYYWSYHQVTVSFQAFFNLNGKISQKASPYSQRQIEARFKEKQATSNEKKICVLHPPSPAGALPQTLSKLWDLCNRLQPEISHIN